MVPSHTLYADDIMIFCRGDQKSVKVIPNLLSRYDACSRKLCNASKFIIYVCEMCKARHIQLANILGFSTASTPFLYLVVPIFIGKPKSIHFQFIVDKVKLKLAAWKANLLSIVGRVQLVKSVIHSMLVHIQLAQEHYQKVGGLDEELYLEQEYRPEKSGDCGLGYLLQGLE